MHRGEDTAHYLRKGFRVVGFEAHPRLVDACRERFAAEIANGRLEIISGAITDADREAVTFYINPRMSGWGTVRSSRNDVLGPRVELTVPAVDFARCLREHGVPYYLKIDIEGSDMLCLEALLDVEPEQRPRYTSIEAGQRIWSGVQRQFDLLERLGYTRFAVVQQAMMRRRYRRITTREGRSIPYRFEMLSSGRSAMISGAPGSTSGRRFAATAGSCRRRGPRARSTASSRREC